MNLTKFTQILVLIAVGFAPAVVFSQQTRPARTTDVGGTVFLDANRNGKLDARENGRRKATVWLYRVMPNGSRKRIAKTRTNGRGEYRFASQQSGKYVIAIRFSNKFSVRRSSFTLGTSRQETVNIPFMTKQTVGSYGSFKETGNPANLDDDNQNQVSQFAP